MLNSTNQIEIRALLKFGNKENIKALIENGVIYINTVKYFNTIEDNFRGDKFEGATQVLQGDKFKLSYINSLGETIKFEAPISIENMIVRDNWENRTSHIYCLYMLKNVVTDKVPAVDKKNLQFGKYAALIYNPKLFMQRISDALSNLYPKWKSGFIEYVDIKKEHGFYSYFKKPLEYAYQNEYRYLIIDKSNLPITIEIGSLKGIAELIDDKGIASISIADD